MKPLVLPAGSDQTTLAYDATTRMLYMLQPKENRLLIQQQGEDGALKTVQELSTGIEPAMIYLARVARLVMVANRQNKTVSVFSIAESGSLTELQTINMEQNPTAIEVNPAERFVYIALEDGGISRFAIEEDRRLTSMGTTATTEGLAGLRQDPTGQMLIGIPKSLEKVCPPGQKCKSWRRAFKKLGRAITQIVKVVVSIVRIAVCPVGPISSFLPYNPLYKACLGLTGLLFTNTGRRHWYKELFNNEVEIKVGANISPDWDPYFNRAIEEWSRSSKLNLRRVTGSSRTPNCRPRLGRIEVCSYNYGRQLGGGMASGLGGVVPLGDHIIAGFAIVDDASFPPWDRAGRQMVMCQEIGHALGLDHQDENFTPPNLGTCMDYTGNVGGGGEWGPHNESPNGTDYDTLSKNYGHIDGIVNIDRWVENAIPIKVPFFTPGKLAYSSANGKIRRYESDYGRGLKMITYATSPPRKR